MLVGSAVAIALNQRKLHVYENGIGAINLPYYKFEIGLDHTRSVHPISLIRTSKFITILLDNHFDILNPYVFKTKAQMCTPLSEDSLTDLIYETQTCDSVHRKKQSQCGYCSSCLLRRQALLANKIVDETEYVLTHGKSKSKNIRLHFEAMISQVKRLNKLLQKEQDLNQNWYELINEYAVLEKTVNEMAARNKISKHKIRKKFIDMYLSYSHEWLSVKDEISNSYSEPITA